WCPKRARDQEEAPDHARACGHPVPHSGSMVTETGGSPTFPSSPSEDLPRSQTLLVSWTLAKAPPGLLPAGACTPSAFLSIPLERYPAVHDSPHFGAPSRGLSPRYTRLRTAPCGEARGFAPDRLAQLESDGTCTTGSHPLGNYNQFHGVTSNSKVSGLPWREQADVRQGMARTPDYPSQ